jgi:hypothetical protein
MKEDCIYGNLWRRKLIQLKTQHNMTLKYCDDIIKETEMRSLGHAPFMEG